MKDNKGTTVLLTVIGIATLLVAVVGATFAYFTASVTDDNKGKTDVTVSAANLGTVVFTHGDTIDLCDDTLDGADCDKIYPGASETKEFKISHAKDENGNPITAPVDYKIYLVTTDNSLRTVAEGETAPQETGNLKATLAAPTSLATGASATSALQTATSLTITEFAKGSEKLIGSGTLAASEDEHNWKLTVELINATDAEGNPIAQNDDQGRTYSAKIVVKADTKYTVNGAEWSTTSGN